MIPNLFILVLPANRRGKSCGIIEGTVVLNLLIVRVRLFAFPWHHLGRLYSAHLCDPPRRWLYLANRSQLI